VIENLITWEEMPNAKKRIRQANTTRSYSPTVSTKFSVSAKMTKSFLPTEFGEFRFLPVKPLGGL
jgi:hypothetical protein